MVDASFPNLDSSNIRASNFGGLNTEASPLTMQPEDSPALLNVNVTLSGSIVKRGGTRVIYEEDSDVPLSLHRFAVNSGYSYIVVKSGLSLKVIEIVDDEPDEVWSKSNVFREASTKTFSIVLPDQYARLLLLCPRQAPVQLRTAERTRFNFTGTVCTFTNAGEFATHFADTVVYVNRVRVAASFSFAGADLEVTLPGAVSGAQIDVVLFTWQWWAESLFWLGENFFRGVSRFGVGLADQHVQVPETTFSDSQRKYLVTPYESTSFGDKYVESPTDQPRRGDEFSFSDGTNYVYDPAKKVTRSPVIVTFGREGSDNLTNFTDDDVDYTNSVFVISQHGFGTYDKIKLNSAIGLIPGGLSPLTEYVVKRLDEDEFELYTDDTLTTKVLFTARATLTFNDVNVDTETDTFNITAHGLTDRDQVRVTSSRLVVAGITETASYFVKVTDANNFKLYFDYDLTRLVNLVPRAERAVLSTEFDDTNDIVTTTGHLLFDKQPVRFRPAGGTLPAGITAFVVYYVRVITPSTFELYTDQNLTTKVTNYAGAAGTVFFYVDGGTHTLRIWSGDCFITRQRFTSVYFSRRRQLRFNGGRGVVPSNLNVTVDGTAKSRSVVGTASATYGTYYTYTGETTPPDFTSNLQQYLAFEAASQIGLDRAALVRMTNTEPLWCGSAANSNQLNPLNQVNGTWVPIYGIGDYADYFTGTFPTNGAVFQGRLILAGFENNDLTLVFSSVSDALIQGETFQYYQITDDLTNPAVDPFDVIVPAIASDKVTALLNYENSLFVFTANSVFRAYSSEVNINSLNRSIGLIANQGAVNQNSVIPTENTIFYLSPSGLYDLSIVTQDNYRAAEVSIKVRSVFNVLQKPVYHDLPWLAYDKLKLRIYVGMPDESSTERCKTIYVLDTQRRAWTQYSSYFYFQSYAGLDYLDKELGQLVAVAVKTPCRNTVIRFDYWLYLDFVTKYTSGTVSPTPCFFTAPTYSGVLEYKLDVPLIPLTNFQDIRVFAGATLSTLAELTWQVDWVKTHNGYIKLTANPGNGFIGVIPNV